MSAPPASNNNNTAFIVNNAQARAEVYKPSLVYAPESKSSVKINMVVGPFFALTFFALAIAASADPGAFGSIAYQVTEGCAIAGTVIGVCSIAYFILLAASSEKEKELERQIEESVTQTEAINSRHYEEQRQNTNDPVDRKSRTLNISDAQQDMQNRRQIASRSPSGKYHNLAANVDSSEGAPWVSVADKAAGNKYQIPYVGKYNPDGMVVPDPKMAVRLPSQQIAQLPNKIRQAIQGDQKVELFFQVFDDRNMGVSEADPQKNVRNVFTQAMYLPYALNESTWVQMGIFEPINVQSHPVSATTENAARYTLPLVPGLTEDLGEIAVNSMGQRLKNVRVHDNGERWSPNNVCVVLEDGKEISSFYFISKTREKTTVSHIVLCRSGSAATQFLDAANQSSVQAFLDDLNLSGAEYQPLVRQIRSEFGL